MVQSVELKYESVVVKLGSQFLYLSICKQN